MRVELWAAVLSAAVLVSTEAAAEPSQTGAAAVAAAVEQGVVKAPAAALQSDAAPILESKPAAEPVEPKPATVVAPPPAPPSPTLLVDIDLTRQRMTVTERGKVKHTWAISSGREGYRTPTGSFRPTWMSRMWYSKQYDDAPMPHSVFFNGGIAVHGTQWIGMLGRPASHGCVRLAPGNAAAFYGLVSSHGKAMTRIKVHGVAKDAPAVASRRPSGLRAEGHYPVRPLPRYVPSPRYPSPRYSYYSYDGGYYGSAGNPRFIYPGDPLPYGYRRVRPLYRPYGGARYYYD